MQRREDIRLFMWRREAEYDTISGVCMPGGYFYGDGG